MTDIESMDRIYEEAEEQSSGELIWSCDCGTMPTTDSDAEEEIPPAVVVSIPKVEYSEEELTWMDRNGHWFVPVLVSGAFLVTFIVSMMVKNS